ncbi:hypothetical protein B0H14DRAFT_2849777 [Mycena olivaceomarginata]|nr:hypothetical protein B0H14DRAFT_2849777 [Mycena olivaceomarginata]
MSRKRIGRAGRLARTVMFLLPTSNKVSASSCTTACALARGELALAVEHIEELACVVVAPPYARADTLRTP